MIEYELRSWGPANPFTIKKRCAKATTGPVYGCRYSICEWLRHGRMWR